MSKIKDLYAIENNIDDLMPIANDDETMVGYRRELCRILQNNISEIKQDMQNLAEFGVGEEYGHIEVYFENFCGLCYSMTENYLDELIASEHIDLTNEQYDELSAYVGDWLADVLADWEQEMIDDYAADSKDMLDIYREEHGQC